MAALVEIASGTSAERLRLALPASLPGSLADSKAEEWGMFPDALEGAGPLAALVAALDRAAAEHCDTVLALACDMPLVTPAELEPLVAAISEGADAALWVVDGIEQPLCAAYSVACAQPAREALERGARRLVATFDPLQGASAAGLRVRRLEPNENSRLRLMNVNTPGDYDSARRLRDDPKGRTAAGPGGADCG